jgi:hypothetical protein
VELTPVGFERLRAAVATMDERQLNALLVTLHDELHEEQARAIMLLKQQALTIPGCVVLTGQTCKKPWLPAGAHVPYERQCGYLVNHDGPHDWEA